MGEQIPEYIMTDSTAVSHELGEPKIRVYIGKPYPTQHPEDDGLTPLQIEVAPSPIALALSPESRTL